MKIENNNSGSYCSQEALKLLPHLFLRPIELRCLKWEFVDFKKNNFLNWKENIIALHKTKDSQNNLSKTYKRLVFDEIFANFLVLSEILVFVSTSISSKYSIFLSITRLLSMLVTSYL